MQQEHKTNTAADGYDVFISCKSEDYAQAGKIYDFLVENGFRVFLASRELRRLGESEYRRAIAKALRTAYHLIVFASKPEYIESEWVYYEWDMFISAKLKGFKQGNIFTILDNVRIDDIPMDLWKYESMTLSNYQELLLNYVETPAHKERLKELEARRNAEEAVLKLKKELKDTAESINEKQILLDTVERRKMSPVLRKLNILTRTCPVCGGSTDIDQTYCSTCAWPFNPVEGIADLADIYVPDRRQLDLHRKLYAKSNENGQATENTVIRLRKDIDDLNKEKSLLSARLSVAEQQAETRLDSIKSLSAEIDRAKQEIRRLEKLLSDSKKTASSSVGSATSSGFTKESFIADIKRRVPDIARSKFSFVAPSKLMDDIFRAVKDMGFSAANLPSIYSSDYTRNITSYLDAIWAKCKPECSGRESTATAGKQYKVSFHISSSAGKLALVKLINEVTGFDLKQSKVLADLSEKQLVTIDKPFSENDAKKLCNDIMNLVTSRAIYKPC